MTVMNTPNQVTPMVLERARSFALRMSFVLVDDTVVDLTGGTITFTMLQPVRKGTAVVLTKDAVLVSPDVGYAVLDLQAAELDLDPGTYPYSITYVDADAYSATVVKGEVTIVGNTDPLTANVYDALALDVQLGFDNVVVTVNHLQAPTLQIGTVETIAYGNPAGAGIRGGYPHQLLDLKIPRGAPGGTEAAYNEAFTAAVAAANAYSDSNDALLQAALDSIEAMATATQAELDGYEASNDAAVAAVSAANTATQNELDSYETSTDSTIASIISTMATDAELAAHAAAVNVHGVAVVVGRDEAQTLKNKNLTDLTNQFPSWLMPVGTILEWPGFTAPDTYLMCDGAAYARATYPALWDVLTFQFAASGAVASGQKVIPVTSTQHVKIGTVIDGPGCGAGNTVASFVTDTSITLTNNITVASDAGTAFRLAPWGNGDGSTTFTVPNRMGNVAAGMDGTSEFYRLGQVYGERIHTLTVAEMPAHNHGGATAAGGVHSHNIQRTIASGGTAGAGLDFTSGRYTIAGGYVENSISHTHGINSQGDDGAHNNIQPSVAMNFIIRAA